MTTLIFDIDELRPIVEHALASKQFSPTYDMMTEPKYWRDELDPGAGGWGRPDDIDPKKIPPHLQLVKDHGVYILSPGIPRLTDLATGAGSSRVVYAKGMGPNDSYDAWSAAGADDFVEALDLDFIAKAVRSNAKKLSIHLTETRLTMDFERVAERAIPEQPPRPKPHVNIPELKRIEALASTTAKARWAGPGQSYKGAIYGYDTHTVMQKVGRRLVVHDKSLLPEIPQKGSTVVIAYPLDNNAVATIEAAVKSKKNTPGPVR